MCCKSVLYFLCISIFLTSFNSYSQETKADIPDESITFEAVEMEGTKIVVYYNIVNSSPIERFEIELAFVDDEDFYYYPKSTTGDVGPGIKGGKKKRIVWDIFQDVDALGRVRPIIIVSSITQVPGGPGKSLLSIPVPGLGDMWVTNTKTAVIKPYYKTILAYGLVGYGVFQKIQYNSFYDDYITSNDRGNFDNLYNKANSANHQFYIFTAMGAAVWLYDVIWVTAKGISNTKNPDNSQAYVRNRFTARPNPHGGINFGYVLTF
ncbi:hypothetical protein ACFLTU_08305 [Bacteroidota bacterium]